MKKVLIIEDDLTMLRGLRDNFTLKGYRVKTSCDGEQGLNTVLDEKPDLVILDIMLPKLNGYEVCGLIREKNLDMPIIMLTAKNEEADIILGLNLGADDYVTKPFSIQVLLARAEAFLRRRECGEPAVYEFDNCQLDTLACTLTREGKEFKLSPGEFRMLQLFLRKSGCVLTREEIRTVVWGYSHFITLRDVDRFVTKLRDKIELNPNNPMFIQTAGRIGYKFERPEQYGNSLNN